MQKNWLQLREALGLWADPTDQLAFTVWVRQLSVKQFVGRGWGGRGEGGWTVAWFGDWGEEPTPRVTLVTCEPASMHTDHSQHSCSTCAVHGGGRLRERSSRSHIL